MRHAPAPDADGKRWYGPGYQRVAEDPKRCIASVSGGRGWHSHQCTRPRKDGTEYCGVHMPAPDDRITMFFVGMGHYDAPCVEGIKTVEVAAMTDHRVQLPNGRWDLKRSKSGVYYMDKDHAIAHIREGRERAVSYARQHLAEVEAELAKFNEAFPK